MTVDNYAGVDINVVENALAFISSGDRDVWVAMGMAIKSEFGEAGFSTWDSWSEKADNYKQKDALSVWRSIKHGGKTGIGSLFHEAKNHGFKFEQQSLSAEDKKRLKDEIKLREKRRKDEMLQQEAVDKRWYKKIADVSNVLVSNYLADSGRSDYLDNKYVRAYGLYFVVNGLIIVTNDDAVDVEIISGRNNISDFFDSGRKDECSFVYIKSGSVAVPMHNSDNNLVNLQFIFPSGNKRFLKHGKKQGTFHVVGDINAADKFFIAEGYSTAVSFFKALKLPGVIAFDSGNLLPVAEIWRKRKPAAEIIIAGDDDHHLKDKNAGKKKAFEAACKVAGKAVYPVFKEAAGRSDFNDMAIEQGDDAVFDCVSRQLTKSGENSSLPGSENDVINPVYDFSLPRLLSDFVVLHGTGGGLFDNKRCEFMSVSDFRTSVGSKITNEFLNSEHRKVILRRNVVFDPTADGELPDTHINLFRGLPLKPKQGDCTLLLEMLFFLCEKNQVVFDWVVKWMAYPLQNVGAKMTTAVVIHGREGAGKNLFWSAIQRIYGDYTSIITQTDLESSFNGWASKKLFVIGNEVVSRQEMFHKKGVMKNMITEPEWFINEKNINQRRESNHANFVFFSNFLQPVTPDKDDRRYLVLWTPPKKEKGYYKRVAKERDSGGVEALYHYLLNVDLGDFDEYTEPLMTEAKLDLIQISMKSDERFIDNWLMGDLPLPVGPVLTSNLYFAYQSWCKRSGEKFYVSLTEFGTLLNKHELVNKLVSQRYVDCTKVTKGTFAVPFSIEKPSEKSKFSWLSECNDDFQVQFKEWIGEN